MKALGTFGRFWYDFIVGDDWTIAAVVVAAVAVTAVLAHNGVAAWWVLPGAVVAVLIASIVRAARAARSSRV